MANEAVIIELGELKGNVIRRTVADGTSISGGTLCKLTDPNTASASTAIGDYFAGIAAADKVANDGSTTLGFYTSGVYDIKSGVVTAGQYVMLSGANMVQAATNALVSGANLSLIVGVAEETATLDEVIRVRLRGY